jgi:hypothetical protein
MKSLILFLSLFFIISFATAQDITTDSTKVKFTWQKITVNSLVDVDRTILIRNHGAKDLYAAIDEDTSAAGTGKIVISSTDAYSWDTPLRTLYVRTKFSGDSTYVTIHIHRTNSKQ